MYKKLTIGIIGFNKTCDSLVKIVQNTKANIIVKKIITHRIHPKSILPQKLFHIDPNIVLNDPEIDTIIEIINDSEESYYTVKTALQKGKNVIATNRKNVATNLEEFIQLQEKYNGTLLYDNTCCCNLATIDNVKKENRNSSIQLIQSILDGSSNYLLSTMYTQSQSYSTVFKQAKALEFIEEDTTPYTNYCNTLYQFIILIYHTFGTIISTDDVLNLEIKNINEYDIKIAQQKNYKIKLIAEIQKHNGNKLKFLVAPKFISPQNSLYNVDHNYTAVLVTNNLNEEHLIINKEMGESVQNKNILTELNMLLQNNKDQNKQKTNYKYIIATNLKIYLRYETPEELKLFQFNDIIEDFKSQEFNYVIGTINFRNLLEIQHQLNDKNLFIAYF